MRSGTATGTLALDHSDQNGGSRLQRQQLYRYCNQELHRLGSERLSYIDKTVVKGDGRTKSIHVTWSVESTALVGDELVPATYSAVATYSGTAYSKTATGYITTADYIGTVSASGVSSIKYTVTYLGTAIEVEPEGNAESRCCWQSWQAHPCSGWDRVVDFDADA